MRRLLPLLALTVVIGAAACGQSGPTATIPSASTASATATPSTSVDPANASPSAAPDSTVWLCRPGLAGNPCAGNLDATAFDANGKSTAKPASSAADPPIDCFYVYPTVSRQTTVNANLTIDPEERAVAMAQAAQFSQVCRVYAPMYPQLTLDAIKTPSNINLLSALGAYTGVDSAFKDYMARYNDGRGIVFIGHSQGAMMLIQLLKTEVDPNPETRKLLVSALLMGGNVTVPIGKSVGGDFSNIPACASRTQTGCVVAYSSFATTPPADALFGRIATALTIGEKSSTVSLQILCVNPAAPGGGTAALQPYLPTTGLEAILGAAAPKLTAPTPFVTYPNQYSAHCVTSGGATWLQVDKTAGKVDLRSYVANVQSATWGLHLIDVNIALGDLVALVRAEAGAYR
jgi:predicted small lipoprotein YifL